MILENAIFVIKIMVVRNVLMTCHSKLRAFFRNFYYLQYYRNNDCRFHFVAKYSFNLG